MRCLTRFSRFPAGSEDYLNVFITDPSHGSIAVHMSQGLGFVCTSFVCYIARNKAFHFKNMKEMNFIVCIDELDTELKILSTENRVYIQFRIIVVGDQ
jgi:hypothetical protein